MGWGLLPPRIPSWRTYNCAAGLARLLKKIHVEKNQKIINNNLQNVVDSKVHEIVIDCDRKTKIVRNQ